MSLTKLFFNYAFIFILFFTGQTYAKTEDQICESLQSLITKNHSSRNEKLIAMIFMSLSGEQLHLIKERISTSHIPDGMMTLIYSKIKNHKLREEVLSHFQSAREESKTYLRILTDIDDTQIASRNDHRYGKQNHSQDNFYPGYSEIVQAIMGADENRIVIHLTSRTKSMLRGSAILPNMQGYQVKNDKINFGTDMNQKLQNFSEDFSSSTTYIAGKILPAMLTSININRPAANVKYKNFKKFKRIYPEYEFIFIGDSAQDDPIAATLLTKHKEVRFALIHEINSKNKQRNNKIKQSNSSIYFAKYYHQFFDVLLAEDFLNKETYENAHKSVFESVKVKTEEEPQLKIYGEIMDSIIKTMNLANPRETLESQQEA